MTQPSPSCGTSQNDPGNRWFNWFQHPFAESDTSENDKLESEWNNGGDKLPKSSGIMFHLSQLTEGGTANAVDGIAPTDDADSTRVE